MARQSGVFQVEGTIGNVTFYKSKDGFMLRLKGGVSGERIATDPAFERTRENGMEFGAAGKAAKLVRTSLRSVVQRVSDSRLVSRLTQEMVKVVKADTVSARGMRNVKDGDLTLLNGFEFNANGKLSTALYAPYEVSIDRVTGKLTVSLGGFIPAQMISAPVGATHFRIVGGAAEVDFASGSYKADVKETATLPLDNKATAPVNLELALTPDGVLPQILVVGVEFLQMVNNEHYQLRNGAFNALAVVGVDVI